MLKRFFVCALSLILLCFGAVTASAVGYDELTEGTYYIDSSLSCYINAMGGVEFGAPLLESSQINVDADGRKTITLYFTKSNVTIYSVSCDTFIDVSPSYVTETNGIKSGTLGFYDKNGVLNTEDIEYTLSEDTAQNAQKEQVHYVASVSFPVEHESETYNLSLFVNSNVMGTQFTMDGYPAVLTVDWSSVSLEKIDKDEESKEETKPIVNTENVEKKDGLNIYHADNETSSDAEPVVSGTYVAYFKEPLLIAVGVTAGVMILMGIILIVSGRKEKKS